MQADGLDDISLVCYQGMEDIMQADGLDGLLPCLLSGHGGQQMVWMDSSLVVVRAWRTSCRQMVWMTSPLFVIRAWRTSCRQMVWMESSLLLSGHGGHHAGRWSG